MGSQAGKPKTYSACPLPVRSALFAVGTWVDSRAGIMGLVDIQIKELAPGGVTGTMKTTAKQGSATKLSTYRNIKSNYQTYRTRIVVEAKQMNINRKEACSAIAHRLAVQIAGLF